MRIKVINTIYSDDLEFGEELLDGIDADLINGRWLDEESLITHSTEADAIICSGPIQAWTPRVIRSLTKMPHPGQSRYRI